MAVMLVAAAAVGSFMSSVFVAAPGEAAACTRVLVIGDSMAVQVGADLEAAFASTGRCAHVVNAAVSGSSVVEWAPGGRFDLRSVLDRSRPELVVVHFVGNEGSSGLLWSDPMWLERTATAALAIVHEATIRGAAVAWALPPKSAWACDWHQLSAQRFAAWHAWIRDELWTTRPVIRVDWRTPFGGESYVRWFEYPDGSVRSLRAVDCVHFSDAGARVAADLTVAETQATRGSAKATTVGVDVQPRPDLPR